MTLQMTNRIFGVKIKPLYFNICADQVSCRVTTEGERELSERERGRGREYDNTVMQPQYKENSFPTILHKRMRRRFILCHSFMYVCVISTDRSRCCVPYLQVHPGQWALPSDADSSRATPPEVHSQCLCWLVGTLVHHQAHDPRLWCSGVVLMNVVSTHSLFYYMYMHTSLDLEVIRLQKEWVDG